MLSENYMPVFEVNQFIDHLIEAAEDSEGFQEDLESKLEIARENEEQQRQERTPGWSEKHEAFVCPHCKKTSNHVSVRDDGGSDCVHCGESVDEYVVPEDEG